MLVDVDRPERFDDVGGALDVGQRIGAQRHHVLASRERAFVAARVVFVLVAEEVLEEVLDARTDAFGSGGAARGGIGVGKPHAVAAETGRQQLVVRALRVGAVVENRD